MIFLGKASKATRGIGMTVFLDWAGRFA